MYDFKEVERKWQKNWENCDDFHAVNFSDKPKYYLLVEFPYPSAQGLHVGHLRSWVALDIVARKRRKEGYNVLYPMGWDAFGLPTENYAIKNNIHPRIATEKNIANFKKQLKSVGISFDWKREIDTTSKDYYKWTQWIFSKLFEKGLAKKEESTVNWCSSCKCVLANEEVVGGNCERCGGEVTQKTKKQWILKITKYAQRLIDDLDLVDYPERVKTQQKNWIGRSEGAKILFSTSVGENLEIFTTLPETIFGVSHIILAPEHKFIDKHKNKIENIDEILAYREKTSKMKKIDRTDANKEKSGVKVLGITAKNLVNNKEIPIFVSDYVLADYGTGVVMAVPAHDNRDFDFVQKYHIDYIPVMRDNENNGKSEMINSDFLNGLDNVYARKKIIEYVTDKKIGKSYISFKLRDWIFARQRYWGEPIPIINCEKCGPVLEENLPLVLPDVENFRTSDSGESPLCALDWVKTKCPRCGGDALRETDTMPQWAGSSWYFLRYLDPENDECLASKEAIDYWMPVDWYNGGMEHTTLHLLYSRFWHKFLYDIGVVSTPEPYKKRTSHGMILGGNNEKMSKSRGNVVNPTDVVDEYGADVIRLYDMFMGDFEKSAPWNTESIKGCKRFLDKYWDLLEIVSDENSIRSDFVSDFNKAVKKVSLDIENLKFNTAIAALMDLIGKIKETKKITKKELKVFSLLLNPFAPHVTSEVWEKMGFSENINFVQWPKYDDSLISQKSHEIVIQINGKIRDKFIINGNINDEELIKRAKMQEKIQNIIKDKKILKEICVTNKLVNLVVK